MSLLDLQNVPNRLPTDVHMVKPQRTMTTSPSKVQPTLLPRGPPPNSPPSQLPTIHPKSFLPYNFPRTVICLPPPWIGTRQSRVGKQTCPAPVEVSQHDLSNNVNHVQFMCTATCGAQLREIGQGGLVRTEGHTPTLMALTTRPGSKNAIQARCLRTGMYDTQCCEAASCGQKGTH